MNIGIDARHLKDSKSGFGSYTTNLIHHLIQIDNENHYFLFIDKEIDDLPSKPNVNQVVLNSKTSWNQVTLPIELLKNRYNLDVFHSQPTPFQ